MYKAIVVSSIQIPQEALFNNLKRSKEQAQNYLNIAGSMFIAIDETRRITLANKKAEEVLGYSQDELIGLNWFDNFIPERTKSDILRIFNELMDGNTETNRTIETSIVTKEGEERTIRWQNSVLKDQNGKIIGTLSSGEDVTIQNKARNMLIASKLEAEAANRTKSEFLANMSHELRTPLNSIIGFSEVLLMKKTGELNEKQTHYANNVVKSGKHLLELINDVLDLSKIEAGKMSFEPENISLPEVLDEVQLLMTPLAYKKSIHLRFSIEFIDIRIFAEKIKFKGILYNLLSNAIKFTPENGRVCVNAKIAEDKVQISVSDTGIGIPEEKLRYIFEPFRQVDSSTSRQYGGTGLGLTLVKKYVEMHGGDIWVESKCGEGSTFSFTIPLNENP
ncbi:PAS domain S-box-containing protein [Methanohalophilus levihalophilus]|nr:PAS domain S-box-containing protein [Methanohalophilus levihalophilus]